MDVALIADEQEIEELRQRPCLAVDGAQPRVGRAEPGQVLIGVGGLGGPCRASQEPKELEQVAPLVGDRVVDHACADHREQVLVDEFLFEVLEFLRGPQPVRRAQGTDHGQRLDYVTSSTLSIRHSYQRSVGNPDRRQLSGLVEQRPSPAKDQPAPFGTARNPRDCRHSDPGDQHDTTGVGPLARAVIRRLVNGMQRDQDRGSVTAYLLIMTVAMVLLGRVVLDGGAALTAHGRAADIAQQAARAGADALDEQSLRATTPAGLTANPAAARAAARGARRRRTHR